MVANGTRYAAMELSSHALDQCRACGVGLDVAVVTNITQDHFDYHGTFDAYRAAKARILDLVKRWRTGDPQQRRSREPVAVGTGGGPASDRDGRFRNRSRYRGPDRSGTALRNGVPRATPPRASRSSGSEWRAATT